MLSQRRTHGMDSPNAISFSDIEAWTRLTGTLVLPEEINMILAMDSAYMSTLSEVREEQRAKDK